MRKIVISQPFFFPWIGHFEQIKLADIFVFYDDVQFSKGGFMNRVQIKTQNEYKWLTIPLKDLHLGQKLNEVKVNNGKEWKKEHYVFLSNNYKNTGFLNEMIDIVEEVYTCNTEYLLDYTIASTKIIADYYGLAYSKQFFLSSQLNITGNGDERVLNIAKYFKADKYITAMGALRYMDFKKFEKNNIMVEFMSYRKMPYNQIYGAFNPFVSTLDLITNIGKEGYKYICSESMYWRDFLKTQEAIDYIERFQKH